MEIVNKANFSIYYICKHIISKELLLIIILKREIKCIPLNAEYPLTKREREQEGEKVIKLHSVYAKHHHI